ncbi:MAG: hypothetical protein GX138_00510, partial [Firmicutes bacterium]|nr:hypothetical protein [Bacillota bacterium]
MAKLSGFKFKRFWAILLLLAQLSGSLPMAVIGSEITPIVEAGPDISSVEESPGEESVLFEEEPEITIDFDDQIEFAENDENENNFTEEDYEYIIDFGDDDYFAEIEDDGQYDFFEDEYAQEETTEIETEEEQLEVEEEADSQAASGQEPEEPTIDEAGEVAEEKDNENSEEQTEAVETGHDEDSEEPADVEVEADGENAEDPFESDTELEEENSEVEAGKNETLETRGELQPMAFGGDGEAFEITQGVATEANPYLIEDISEAFEFIYLSETGQHTELWFKLQIPQGVVKKQLNITNTRLSGSSSYLNNVTVFDGNKNLIDSPYSYYGVWKGHIDSGTLYLRLRPSDYWGEPDQGFVPVGSWQLSFVLFENQPNIIGNNTTESKAINLGTAPLDYSFCVDNYPEEIWFKFNVPTGTTAPGYLVEIAEEDWEHIGFEEWMNINEITLYKNGIEIESANNYRLLAVLDPGNYSLRLRSVEMGHVIGEVWPINKSSVILEISELLPQPELTDQSAQPGIYNDSQTIYFKPVENNQTIIYTEDENHFHHYEVYDSDEGLSFNSSNILYVYTAILGNQEEIIKLSASKKLLYLIDSHQLT